MKRSPAELDALVAQALLEAGPVSAYELSAWLGRHGNPVREVQVYRVLKRLIARGQARQVWLGRRYVAQYPGAAPVLALSCRACSTLETVAAPRIDRALRELAVERGFSVDETVMEASGLCRACVDRAGRRQP